LYWETGEWTQHYIWEYHEKECIDRIKEKGYRLQREAGQSESALDIVS
jgi:hypothetical protein